MGKICSNQIGTEDEEDGHGGRWGDLAAWGRSPVLVTSSPLAEVNDQGNEVEWDAKDQEEDVPVDDKILQHFFCSERTNVGNVQKNNKLDCQRFTTFYSLDGIESSEFD